MPTPVPPAPAPPSLAIWTPLDAAPRASEARAVVRLGDRELRLDAADARWLFRSGAEPARSESFEGAPLAAVALLDRGTLAMTQGGRLLYAADDLGPFQPVSELPAGTSAVTVYRGGVTLRAADGVAFFRPPSGTGDAAVPAPLWLPPFEGRRALDARIGADCAGLVVFTPQRLASTRDCGGTYQPIDDRGVYAESLLVDGDRVVIAPGGEHDVFARAFTPGATRLERSLLPASSEQPASATKPIAPGRIADSDLRRALDTKAPMRASVASFLRSEYRPSVAVDGDRVFLFSNYTLFGAGPLGGGITWIDRAKQWPGCKFADTSFTACGGTRVLACEGVTYAWAEGGGRKPFDGAEPVLAGSHPRHVALQGSRQLFFSGLEGLFRVDLRGSSEPVPIARAAGAELRTRCDESQRSPVWIGVSRVVPADRAWSDAPVDDTAVIRVEPPPSFKGLPVAIGMARDGSLVVRDGKSGALAVLHEDGRAEERTLPGSGGAALAIAFNDDGRGLAVERATGRAFQSDDAGATWFETRGPGRPIGDAGLFCTASRCEVEGLFLRRGWDEAVPTITAPSESAHADAAAPPLPLASCVPDPGTAPRMPPGTSPDAVAPTFGPAGALWAAMDLTSGKETEEHDAWGGPMAKRTLTMLVGAPDGSVKKTLAASWNGPLATTASMVLAREGILFLWMDARGIGSNIVSAQPNALGAYAGDGRAPPRRIKAPFDEVSYAQGEFAFSGATFATDSGLAVLNTRSRDVLWLDARGTPATRPWPGDAESRDGADALDALAKRGDGTWIAIETGPSWARVVAVAPDGVTATRMMARARMDEQGVGIVASGGDVDVALVEEDESGAAAIRLHRVEADLALGPARTIPGTQAVPGLPIPLPSCAGAPLPGVMDLAARIVVDGGGKAEPATLLRRLRFDATRACVERTQLGGEGLRVVTLGALDGPGVLARAGAPISGSRCRWLRSK
jgi:hypothetical protein